MDESGVAPCKLKYASFVDSNAWSTGKSPGLENCTVTNSKPMGEIWEVALYERNEETGSLSFFVIFSRAI